MKRVIAADHPEDGYQRRKARTKAAYHSTLKIAKAIMMFWGDAAPKLL